MSNDGPPPNCSNALSFFIVFLRFLLDISERGHFHRRNVALTGERLGSRCRRFDHHTPNGYLFFFYRRRSKNTIYQIHNNICRRISDVCFFFFHSNISKCHFFATFGSANFNLLKCTIVHVERSEWRDGEMMMIKADRWRHIQSIVGNNGNVCKRVYYYYDLSAKRFAYAAATSTAGSIIYRVARLTLHIPDHIISSIDDDDADPFRMPDENTCLLSV